MQICSTGQSSAWPSSQRPYKVIMKEQIENLIKTEINPRLALHMGGCELVSVEDGIAKIKLTGSCTHCPGKRFTFQNNVVPFLIANVEGLNQVLIVD